MSRISFGTRRQFLGRGLGIVGTCATLPTFLLRTALAGPEARSGERILVVVQLSGGHDGLSAVVPYGDDNYARVRTGSRIGAQEVLKIDDQIGLHPNLKGLSDLLQKQAFGVVQGVGYPNPNRSHFTSMDIWHYADPTRRATTYGWIGRYCDHAFQGNTDPALTLSVGGDRAPRALQGKEHPGLSIQRPEAYRFFAEKRLGSAYRQLTTVSGSAGNELQFVSRTALAANASSDSILRIAGQKRTGASYPTTQLGESLKTVGALIAGGMSTRVYYVFHGGYDTHAGQRQRHDRLMTDLNDALTSFQKDLQQQGNAERVLTMGFSEFGRRVRENGSQGTDHGTAGPLFLLGSKVKPGLHGKHPSLAPADLQNGDMRFGIDFRRVYATVLEKWLGVTSRPVLGADYPCLDFIG